jgi:hypothetical protein
MLGTEGSDPILDTVPLVRMEKLLVLWATLLAEKSDKLAQYVDLQRWMAEFLDAFIPRIVHKQLKTAHALLKAIKDPMHWTTHLWTLWIQVGTERIAVCLGPGDTVQDVQNLVAGSTIVRAGTVLVPTAVLQEVANDGDELTVEHPAACTLM